MTNLSNAEFGDTQALTHMIDAMRKGQLHVTRDENPLPIGQILGRGGTKTVYETTIDEHPFALALPNVIDGPEIITQKWRVALNEPGNTEKVRALGLFTNPKCELLPVNISGVPFTAILMARYQDLPYPIMDGKNSASSTIDSNILPQQLDTTGFEDYFSGILPDLEKLIQNGVRVGKDSFNICLVDGKPRIYLSDLGSAKFEEIPRDGFRAFSEGYVRFAEESFINSLGEEEYQHHKSFFEGEAFSVNNADNISNRLTGQLLERLNSVESS